MDVVDPDYKNLFYDVKALIRIQVRKEGEYFQWSVSVADGVPVTNPGKYTTHQQALDVARRTIAGNLVWQ